jgi:hypothetical protein
MRLIKFDNRRYQNQPFRIATYRNTLSRVMMITTFLVISLLASLPEVSRAQPCGSCSDITIDSSAGTTECSCMGDACTGGTCDNQSYWKIALSESATCCIDSIQVNPPVGVCWEGCMSIPTHPIATLWGFTPFAPHVQCNPGECTFFAPTGFNLCAPPATNRELDFNLCTSSSTSVPFTLTLFWSDGTSCTQTISPL